MALWALAAGSEDRRAGYGFDHDAAIVGWSRTGDLRTVGSVQELRDRLARAYPGTDPATFGEWANQLWAFGHDIVIGDLIAVRLEASPEVAFGRITGPYTFDPGAPENRQHQHPAEWMRRTAWDALDADLRRELETPLAVYRVRDPSAPAVAAGTAAADGTGHHLSRRAFVGGGAAAAVVAAVAVWKPWNSSGSSTVARHSPPTTGGHNTGSGVHSSPNGPVASWVQAENAKPGTSAWNVSNGGKPGDLEGYASQVERGAGRHGDALRLHDRPYLPRRGVPARLVRREAGPPRLAVPGDAGPEAGGTHVHPRHQHDRGPLEPVAAGHHRQPLSARLLLLQAGRVEHGAAARPPDRPRRRQHRRVRRAELGDQLAGLQRLGRVQPLPGRQRRVRHPVTGRVLRPAVRAAAWVSPTSSASSSHSSR